MAEKNSESAKIAVVGGGSWATAIVKILSENNVKINWWLRSREDIQHIKQFHVNPRYLSNIQINLKKVRPTNELRKAVQESEVIILVVPSAFVRDALSGLKAEDLAGKIVVSAVKGMIPEQNIVVTDYVKEMLNVPDSHLAAVAGPCHSEEISMEKRSYLTIAGNDPEIAKKVADLLACRFVKTSVLTDLHGVEFCAVMKNIYALACGIAHGLNYGDNFQAVLVSNAMQEVSTFLSNFYPYEKRDVNHSAYLGDLLVTCYSQFSRNRTFGNMIGRGYSVKSAQMEMNMVAEGYYAVKCVNELIKDQPVKMPIIRAVYNILYEKISPSVEVRILENSMI